MCCVSHRHPQSEVTLESACWLSPLLSLYEDTDYEMKNFGIKFAPLTIPFERRLQTLSAFIWFVSLALGNFVCLLIFAYVLLFTSYWPITLLYLCWAYYDREIPYKGGRKNWMLQNLPCWKYFNDYFPIRLEKTCNLNENRNYIFCCHPHGILCAGMFGNFASGYSKFKTLFPGLNMFCATLDMHFRSPVFRDYILGLGGVSTAKESLEFILKGPNKGNVIALAVGGSAESFFAKPGTYRIYLKRRKGFIKIALETGSSIVPVFSFGETDLFDQVPNPPGSLLYKIQKLMKDYTGFAPLVPIGRGFFQYSFGLIPVRTPITTVVGDPIDLPKMVDPSVKVIEKYHAMYTEALTNLFNKHKYYHLKNPNNAVLIIE